MRVAITKKKIFPSTFRRAMPLNWLMLQESFSFGMNTVTALHHAEGIAFPCNTHQPQQQLQDCGAVLVDFVRNVVWSGC